MNLYYNFSFNKSNISKKYQNKGYDKNNINSKRNNNTQKTGAYIINSNNNTNNKTTLKNNIETYENSGDISFYNTSLKNQILSPDDEDDIYQFNLNNRNFEVIQKNSDDIDFNYLTLRNIDNSNYIKNNITNYKKENKKTLILDLDETLIHSSFQPLRFNNRIIKPDFSFKIFFNYKYHEIFSYKRPFLSKFLKEMNKLFNIYIFTASIKKYAKPLLKLLDKHNYVMKKFYRESCILSEGKYIKDLSLLKIKLNDVIILDNNPISYKFNKKNGIPIKSWHFDKNDNELLKILPLLEFLSNVDDVRKYIPYIIENDEINYNKISSLIYASNRNKRTFSLNKYNKKGNQNIRLNKKINYNFDEEMKVNYINNINPGTINFREPSKNKIPKIPHNNYSIDKYKNDIITKNIKKKKRKSKSNSISVINFNLEKNNNINNELAVNGVENCYILNKLNDKYYRSCNNFYINSKYSFVINKENDKSLEQNIKKNKTKKLNLNNKTFNNEESEKFNNNNINSYKINKSKSKKIPCLRKYENKICLNKKLNYTDNDQNIVINNKSCKFKNYLNRFNSYKNILPYKNFESCENDYYTLKPNIKLKDDYIHFRKNNTIEALGKNNNSIRNIICYNNANCINTLNNNGSSKNTINYERKLYNEKNVLNCINTNKYSNKDKYFQSKENSNKKKLTFMLNKENTNRNLIKKNIHKLLALNLKNIDMIKNPYNQTNNQELLTGRINNINDNNLFSNYSLKKEKINLDKNCYIKRKMKLKSSLLNKKNAIKENTKSGYQEDNYPNFGLLNYIPSSERNYNRPNF